ncbi:hypothetical protein HUT19_28150 [Streptomyces sp. NA02950]|uniref:hypothetical protein n=1 Tax=Streptomyces sp. NA02950 TaxID=2742137 RepID=UPI00158FC0E3|nr:hypothetical protein [Streptomyces sp. NA02950]QKV95133.1 hypothetical protein HUT19_28150 [Streptomyces sp. NA02950]
MSHAPHAPAPEPYEVPETHGESATSRAPDTGHAPAASRRKPKSRGVVGGRARRARPRRGRRVMVTAAVLGPVLAALFVAELANEGYFREAAPAPAPEKPVADRGDGVTESAGPVPHDSGGPSTDPATESRRPDKDTKDGDKEKGEGEKKARDTTSPGPDQPTSHDPAPSAPDAGGPASTRPRTPSSKPRPTAPGTFVPTPTPTPSERCDRFLWWCT